MKKIALFSILAVLASLSTTSTVKAQLLKNFYVSIGGGANIREQANDVEAMAIFDPGVIGRIAVGYRFEDVPVSWVKNFSAELEYSKQFNKIDRLWLHPMPRIDTVENASGFIDIEAIQLVLRYEFKSDGPVTPFIGLGLGIGRSYLRDLGCYTLSRVVGPPSYPLNFVTPFSFAISPRFGFNYKVSDNFDLGIAARYHNAPNGVLVMAGGQQTNPNVDAWSSELDLTYNF